MLTRISNFCLDYYDQLPKDTSKAIGLSGIFTFTASFLIHSAKTPDNTTLALTKASLATLLAVTATIIHAVTTPLFNYLFDNRTNEFSGFQEFTKYFFTVVISGLLIHYSTPYKVHVATVHLFPHTFLKIAFGVSFGIVDKIGSIMGLPGILDEVSGFLGMDFKSNPAPVYLTV